MFIATTPSQNFWGEGKPVVSQEQVAWQSQFLMYWPFILQFGMVASSCESFRAPERNAYSPRLNMLPRTSHGFCFAR